MIWDKLSPFYDFFENIYNGKASILELPFKDDKFDVVVAANVIHLLDEPNKAISELKRVCKPNGKIILPTYINNELHNISKVEYSVVEGRMPCAFAIITNC